MKEDIDLEPERVVIVPTDEPRVVDLNESFDILSDDEKVEIWEGLLHERQRHANLAEESNALRRSSAARKKRKKLATESRRRNQE